MDSERKNTTKHLSIVENQTLEISLPNGEILTVEYRGMDMLKDSVFIGLYNEKGQNSRVPPFVNRDKRYFETQVFVGWNDNTIHQLREESEITKYKYQTQEQEIEA